MKLTKDNAQLYCGVAGTPSAPAQPKEPACLVKVDTVAEANALMFDCPVPGHGHGILVYLAPHGNAPPVHVDWRPKPRWQVSGTDLSNITLSPSINLDVPSNVCAVADCQSSQNPCPKHPGGGRKDLPPGCRWHGWVQNGEAKP